MVSVQNESHDDAEADVARRLEQAGEGRHDLAVMNEQSWVARDREWTLESASNEQGGEGGHEVY